MKRILFIILSATLLVPRILYPAATVLSVDSGVKPDKARVGDALTYTITVNGAGLESLNVALPEKGFYYPESETGEKSAAAEKKSGSGMDKKESDNPVPLYEVRESTSTSSGRGNDTLSIKILMTYLRTGTYTLPEIKITGSDGVTIGYRIPSVTIIETNAEGKFEEIEEPLDPPTDYSGIIITVLALLIICGAVAAAAWYFYRRYRRQKELLPAGPGLSPYGRFMIELEKLGPGEIIAKGKVKQYAFGMSMIFRRYISWQFGFDAAEMTTDEIRLNLKSFLPVEIYDVYGSDIIRMLDFWDMSKFAGFEPSADLLMENLSSTGRLAEKISKRDEVNVTPGL